MTNRNIIIICYVAFVLIMGIMALHLGLTIINKVNSQLNYGQLILENNLK